VVQAATTATTRERAMELSWGTALGALPN
jgi:hypothetical protein